MSENTKIESVVVPERQITMVQYDGDSDNATDVTEFLESEDWSEVDGRPTLPGDWLYLADDGEVCVMSARAKEAFTRTITDEAG